VMSSSLQAIFRPEDWNSYDLLLPVTIHYHFPIFTILYEGVSKNLRTESITKYTLTFGITRWEETQRVMVAKVSRLTHKQRHNCT
jgi:hypothetical protein